MIGNLKPRSIWSGILLLALVILLPSSIKAAELSAAQREVIRANEAFYSAFRSRDMEAMNALWARTVAVAVIHPGWPDIAGRGPVMKSWQMIFEGGSPPKIRSVDPKAYVNGESAFVICYEEVGNGYLIATNIFVREDGEWRMVHHQAGPSPAPQSAATEERI